MRLQVVPSAEHFGALIQIRLDISTVLAVIVTTKHTCMQANIFFPLGAVVAPASVSLFRRRAGLGGAPIGISRLLCGPLGIVLPFSDRSGTSTARNGESSELYDAENSDQAGGFGFSIMLALSRGSTNDDEWNPPRPSTNDNESGRQESGVS